MRNHDRLNAILELIDEPGKVVADIGCDHGELAKELICRGKAKKVIATDISAKSLEKAQTLVKRFNLENQIETRVGDGLQPLVLDEAQVVVVAGMGGREIEKILSSGKNYKIERFILQPVQNVVSLRQYLGEDFIILKDFIVKDKNKFYNILEVRRREQNENKQVLSELELEFGLTNFDLWDNFAVYLRAEEKRIKDILQINKSEKLEKRLRQVEGLLKENNHARNDKVSRD